MIKTLTHRILNSTPSNSINSAALIIGAAGVLSRLLGLVRDRILAAQFGAGDALDVYYAAFRVPDLIYNLLVLGALSAAFIPVFTGLLAKDDESEAWKLANCLLSTVLLVLAVISIVFAIFTPQLMKLVTPGFSGEKLDQVIHLTRIMFLSPILLGVSGVFGGILNSFKRFLVYSLAPILYNLGIIIGAVFFVQFTGIAGLAWGVILGAFLHMFIQYPVVKVTGFSFRPSLDFKDPYFRKVVRLMIPRTMGLAMAQINLLVITIIASTLTAGSLAVFNFANNLQNFPVGIFAIPFALAVFPTLAHHAVKEEKNIFIENFSKTLRQTLYFILPASILLIILRAQIVRVVLGAGKFDWEDTILTFQALGIFAFSLFAQGLIPLLARSFYAIQNTRIPFFTGLVGEIVNVVLAIYLAQFYGVLGLVWAFTIASIVNMGLLFFILNKKMNVFADKRIISSLFRISLATIIAGSIAQAAKYAIDPFITLDTFLAVFAQLAISGSLGIGVYLFVTWLLKMEEFEIVKKLLSGKFLRARPTIPEDPTQASGI